MDIVEQFEFEKTGRIDPEHTEDAEPGVEADGPKPCLCENKNPIIFGGNICVCGRFIRRPAA